MLTDHFERLFARLTRSVGVRPGRTRASSARSDESSASGGTSVAEAPRPDSELATPAERILAVTAENGGRVEQAEIVSVLECSAATVSRRLAELEDEGEVVRYKVGRKKVVCLPDEVKVPGDDASDHESGSSERARVPPAA